MDVHRTSAPKGGSPDPVRRVRRRFPAALVRGALLSAAVVSIPVSLGAQSVLDRSPNLSNGWVGSPGVLHFHLVHRFWMADLGDERKVTNSPTMLAALPLPSGFMAGAQFASNSFVAGDRANEWEAFLRWAPLDRWDGPLRAAVTGARNGAAGSWDADLTLALRPAIADSRVTLIGSARRLGDAFGNGEAGVGATVGASLQVTEGLALAGDIGSLRVAGEDEGTTWGAGIQLRIPATPHTLSIQVANTRTATLQGISTPFRTTWGFEFTVPLTAARYLPRSSGRTGARSEPGNGTEFEVLLTDDLRFVPDTLRVPAGTTVLWRNTGTMIHTVTADPAAVRNPDRISLPPGAEPFDSGILRGGESFRHTFTVSGTYVYECSPHEMVGMRGVIIVTPASPTSDQELR